MFREHLRRGLILATLSISPLVCAQTPEPIKSETQKSEAQKSEAPKTETQKSQTPKSESVKKETVSPETNTRGTKDTSEKPALEKADKEKKGAPIARSKVSTQPSELLYFIASPTLETNKEGIVIIDATRAPGAFRSLRLKNVGDNELDLTRVQILYSDGSVHNEDRPIKIKKDERTRKIAETPNNKFIDRVTLSWKATGGQTKLQVIGYQTSEGRKEQRLTPPVSPTIETPPPATVSQGGTTPNQPLSPEANTAAPGDAIIPLVILPESPVFFAAPMIDLSIDGRIALDTTRSPGAFRSVRIRNEEGNPVDLTNVQIVYSDGTVHTEDRLVNIKKGERTRKIAETANDRFIDKITLSWKATGGQAKLQVIGYQTSEGRKLQRPYPAVSQNVPPPAASPVPNTAPQPSPSPPQQVQIGPPPPEDISSSPLVVLPESPIFIASPKIDLSIDGSIALDTTKTSGAFRSVRIRNSSGNPVELTHVQILYNDGTVHDEDRPIIMKKRERTRKIAESLNDKFIDKITLSWKATGGRTKLQVIGYQTAEGRRLERSNTALSQIIQNPGALPVPQIGPMPNISSAQEPSALNSKEGGNTLSGKENAQGQENTPSVSLLPPAPPSEGAQKGENSTVVALNQTKEEASVSPQSPTGATDLANAPFAPSPDQGMQEGTPSAPSAGPLSSTQDNRDISFTGDDLLLAYQNISLSIERHNIKINPDIGKIAHIRFSAIGGDLKITSFKVLYMDGSFQDVTLNAELKDQGVSPWVELQGDKFIREIEYNNQTKKNSKEIVRIEILGQHIKGWLVDNNEAKKFNQGWALLGAKTTSFKNIDKDTFKLAENDGGFTRLKIVAKDRPLTLREVRVVFYSGPDQVFSIKDRVDPQKPYGPLEFRAVRSAIKEIQVKYRARIDLANSLSSVIESAPAIVEVWGQY